MAEWKTLDILQKDRHEFLDNVIDRIVFETSKIDGNVIVEFDTDPELESALVGFLAYGI